MQRHRGKRVWTIGYGPIRMSVRWYLIYLAGLFVVGILWQLGREIYLLF